MGQTSWTFFIYLSFAHHLPLSSETTFLAFSALRKGKKYGGSDATKATAPYDNFVVLNLVFTNRHKNKKGNDLK